MKVLLVIMVGSLFLCSIASLFIDADGKIKKGSD